MNNEIRINKYIADQGWSSRREADTLIEKGLIFVNNKKAIIGQKISSADKVELRGETKEKIYLAYYKGRGIITHSPNIEKGEIDILTKLKSQSKEYYPLLEGMFPIGRLDMDSEGLIILTNDGRLTAPITNPNNGHEKEYEVTVDKKVNKFLLRHLSEGVNIEGYLTKTASAEQKSPHSFILTLTEGKKHQIRRMCAALGFQVSSLKRVRILNIELKGLKPNQHRKIKDVELQEFLKILGILQ